MSRKIPGRHGSMRKDPPPPPLSRIIKEELLEIVLFAKAQQLKDLFGLDRKLDVLIPNAQIITKRSFNLRFFYYIRICL